MKGLSPAEVDAKRKQFGSNTIELKEDRVLLSVLKEIVLEPMFLLLLAACIIYFITGQQQEGIIMLVSIFLVAGISIFQEYRSRNAIAALKKLSQAHVKVIRNGKEEKIDVADVVVDDIILAEEGELVAADAEVMESRDFTVNESILTGEAFAITKQIGEQLYRGTLVTSGRAIAKVTAVGMNTSFGKVADAVQEVQTQKTPLQQQIKSFVKNMVLIGAVAFILVVALNYIQTNELIKSIMQGLTLAMSILPEEIPVAFSTFQALGAFRLLRQNIIVKQPQYVETLGAASVICADKTGTLTENRMSIEWLYDGKLYSATEASLPTELIEFAMWSSETSPFDPMEKAIHQLYEKTTSADLRVQYDQIHEYPISGIPPIMTHIFQHKMDGAQVIAAKGAVERIIRICHLPVNEAERISSQALAFAKQGLRVLGVAKGSWTEKSWPEEQDDFNWSFLGLIAFQDPPKTNIKETISHFTNAGISVKMITGDYPETAVAIANQIGLQQGSEILTGEKIKLLSVEDLKEKIKQVNIFARMFPEAKLKIINALKDNGEIVAMTGDGVNDGPALKAAHIGVAMGKRGSEVAKSSASLILTDDDLAHMVDAVGLGRKIYDNLKKAIQYIVSIHIPIILIVTLPLVLGWAFTDIFSPVHVIFMELIMGPTCSIIYENEPMEPGTMNRPPRSMTNTFLSFRQLMISVMQGLMITAGCLIIGYIYLQKDFSNDTIRTIIFTTLLLSNVFLTLTNRSFYHSVFKTFQYKNNLLPAILAVTLLFITALLFIPGLQNLFRTTTLSLEQFMYCVAIALISTWWIEIIKWFKRRGVLADDFLNK